MSYDLDLPDSDLPVYQNPLPLCEAGGDLDDFAWAWENNHATLQGEDRDDIRPPELSWPLPVVYTAEKNKAFVYAMPSCFRVLCKNKKPIYTDDNYKKFKLIITHFTTFKAAKAFADEYVYARFSSNRKTFRNLLTRTDFYDDDECVDNNRHKYLDLVYRVDYYEYHSARYSYPGDFYTDNVYWWNRGYFKACQSTCRSTPSWVM